MAYRIVLLRIPTLLIAVASILGVALRTPTCPAAEATTQTITLLPPKTLGRISPMLTGVNLIYGSEKDRYWENPAMVKAVKELVGEGMLRYPGGEVTSVWHWQHPTGQLYASGGDTWDPHFHSKIYPPSQWMGLGEYFQLMGKTHATALVGINVESGFKYHLPKKTAKQTTDLIQHLQSKKYPVRWYYIDNETYLHYEAKEYAQAVHRAATEIRRLQPNAKIIINWQMDWDKGWDTIMKIAGHDFDMADVHAYWKWRHATFAHWLEQPHLIYGSGTLSQRIRDMRKHLRASGSSAKIGFLEWNIGGYPQGDQRPSTFETALIVSEMMMQYVDGKLDAACFWPLHTPRGRFTSQCLIDPASLQQGQVRVTPIYRALHFFTPLGGNMQVAVHTPGPETQAVAAIDPKSQKLMLCILRKDARAANIHLEVPPSYSSRLAADRIDIQTLHVAGEDTHVNQAQVSPVHGTIDRHTGQVIFKVPGFSLTKVALSLP